MENLTPTQVAEQMLERLVDIDWGFTRGSGICQMSVTADRVIKWCEAMDWEIPEGTRQHAREAMREDE